MCNKKIDVDIVLKETKIVENVKDGPNDKQKLIMFIISNNFINVFIIIVHFSLCNLKYIKLMLELDLIYLNEKLSFIVDKIIDIDVNLAEKFQRRYSFFYKNIHQLCCK